MLTVKGEKPESGIVAGVVPLVNHDGRFELRWIEHLPWTSFMVWTLCAILWAAGHVLVVQHKLTKHAGQVIPEPAAGVVPVFIIVSATRSAKSGKIGPENRYILRYGGLN
jgi:hypothetical protein